MSDLNATYRNNIITVILIMSLMRRNDDVITGSCYKCQSYTDIYKKSIIRDDIGLCLLCFCNAGPTKITKNIYLSDCENAKKYGILKQLGIKQILTIGSEIPKHKTTDFKTMHINLDDSPSSNMYAYFAETYKFIRRDKTLVHCMAGISRSATIVINYLMQKNRITYDEAYKICKKKRPIIEPNLGFIQQLKRMESMMKRIGYFKKL